MDISGVIQIKKAIVHILDKKNGIVESNYEIDLNDKLNLWITKYINTSNIHKSRMFAKFSNNDTSVRNSCVNILNEKDFIENSKNISHELFDAMKQTNASSANLLIVYFVHGNKKAIAIIKLDFNENFYTEEVDIEGTKKVVVKIQGSSFSDSDKLRKSAIINEDINNEENNDFLLLDTQNGDTVSDYFRNSFLECELINNDKINTNNMIKEITSFINEKYKEAPKDLVNKTFKFTNYLENNEYFMIDEALTNLFEISEFRDEFKEKVKNKKIDFEFNIHKSSLEKKLNNRTIVTETGISLKARASLFNSNDIIIEQDENDNEYCDIIIKKVKIDKNKI